jgi:outer membrane protein assembly factor BamB
MGPRVTIVRANGRKSAQIATRLSGDTRTARAQIALPRAPYGRADISGRGIPAGTRTSLSDGRMVRTSSAGTSPITSSSRANAEKRDTPSGEAASLRRVPGLTSPQLPPPFCSNLMCWNSSTRRSDSCRSPMSRLLSHWLIAATLPAALGLISWRLLWGSKHYGVSARVLWASSIDGLTGCPVLDGSSRVYVLGTHELSAVDQRTGRRIWTASVKPAEVMHVDLGQNGMVLVSAKTGIGTDLDGERVLWGLDPTSGAKRWSVRVDSQGQWIPVSAGGGDLLVARHGLTTLAERDGRVKFSRLLPSEPGSGSGPRRIESIAVTPRSAYVICGNDRRLLYAVSRPGCRVRWRKPLGQLRPDDDGLFAASMIRGSDLVLVQQDQRVVAGINGENGKVVWEGSIGLAGSWTGRLRPDGRLYLASWDGEVKALDAGAGTVLWATRIGYKVGEPPYPGPDGLVYAGCGPNTVVALDRNTGSVLWSLGLGDGLMSSLAEYWDYTCPAVTGEGTIFATSTNGRLYALAPPRRVNAPSRLREGLPANRTAGERRRGDHPVCR